MMSKDLARCFDPVLFARDCGVEPDPWQANLLRTRPHRSLMLCPRQTGKSTVAQLTALWTALYEPQSLVVIVSPSDRQSTEMLDVIARYHSALDAAPLDRKNMHRMEFANGSKVIALPGTERTIRGIAAVHLIVIDEAARIDDALIAAVFPFLATTNGSLICLTTPKGRRGFFFEQWTGTEQWTRTKITVDECPRISKAFLDEQMRKLGPVEFSEEYGLEFRDSIDAAFPSFLIDRAFSDQEVELLWQ
jgi:hypothetical protein